LHTNTCQRKDSAHPLATLCSKFFQSSIPLFA
jgi:hypothetical protein